MADVAITNTTITALNADQTFTANAATEDVADTAQKFVYTPGTYRKGTKLGIFFSNGTGHGAYTYSIAAGDMWASVAAKTGSIAAGAIEVIQVDTAKYTQSDGTIEITLTPAGGKRLKTDHTASMYVLELL